MDRIPLWLSSSDDKIGLFFNNSDLDFWNAWLPITAKNLQEIEMQVNLRMRINLGRNQWIIVA